ncbi:MAG: serine/threonine-protein phosphatase [Phycisphaerales bacterium]|nr:MAG: serine/threonine-protein phosphatase [Phycisphaerales bacterium]
MTSTFTSEFREEYEAERVRWLRKRFLWYAGVIIGFGVIVVLAAMLPLFGVGMRISGLSDQASALATSVIRNVVLVSIFFNLVLTGVYVWAFVHVRRQSLSRDTILRLVYWMIVATGVMSLVAVVISQELFAAGIERVHAVETAWLAEQAAADPEAVAAEPTMPVALRSRSGVELVMQGLNSILWTHFFASLFLPWTPRESIKPILPLLALNAVITTYYMQNLWGMLVVIALSPLVAGPGLLVCWWRYGRFRNRFHYNMLRGRYTEMKRELTDARRIHESLFPGQLLEGPVRMTYRYEPMRQIGGDYLHARFSPSSRGPEPCLNLAIVDVTGHGIPAALTVNRLHGEIERLFAENPDASPGFMLERLNRYVHLTLATHSVYVTAICFRVDPNPHPDHARGTLEWASGGHPPAFVRAVDGSLHQLDSTAFVLGACHGDDFRHDARAMAFEPGDVLLAYTDGATEARDRAGKMLRIEGVQRIVAGAPIEGEGSLAQRVLDAVDHHRFGPPADDTLIVEITRPIPERLAPRHSAAAAATTAR